MTIYYASDSVGNDAWDGLAPAFVSGSTGPKRTARAAMALLAADGDQVALKAGDSFAAETPGTLGILELTSAFNNITITTYGGTSRAVVDFPTTAKTITSVTSGATTVLTCNSHGKSAGEWISGFSGFAARGITGLDGNAGYLVSVTTNTMTVNLSSTGTWTAGSATIQCWERTKSVLNASGNTGSQIQHLELTHGNMGVTVASTAGVLTSGITFFDCYVHHNNYHGAAHQDAVSTGESSVTWSYCVFDHNRNDHCNAQGNGTTGWFKLYGHHCTMTRGGFDPDDVASFYTPAGSSSRATDLGGGDGYTTHSKSYGDFWSSTISYGSQSGCAFVNTTNTNRVWNCFIFEITGQGMSQTGGGNLTAFGNMVIAPVILTPDTKQVPHGNIHGGSTGTMVIYQNTSVSARGANTNLNTDVYCFRFNNSANVTFKNNAAISNGTAGLVYALNNSLVEFLADYNYYSHTGSLFYTSAAAKTFAAWQALTVTIPAHTIGEAHTKTGGTNIKGGSAPTAILDFYPVPGSVMLRGGTDLSGVGITELRTDYFGTPRGSVPDIGALQSLVLGTAFGGWTGFFDSVYDLP